MIDFVLDLLDVGRLGWWTLGYICGLLTALGAFIAVIMVADARNRRLVKVLRAQAKAART